MQCKFLNYSLLVTHYSLLKHMSDKEKVIQTLGGVLSSEHVPESPYYITTPIYYVNDKPHIGHAYTTIVCDVMARYWRLRGREVVYVTGTDENSQKNFDAAQKAGKELQPYLDEMAEVWVQSWKDLEITNTDFIRTTEKRHRAGVEKFWKVVEEAGDIYKGSYEGWYCVGCEAFLLESDLDEGNCPMHKKPVDRIEEENYFFRLSKYRDALLEYINVHPEFVQPESRKHEIINYIKDHMEDISISRHKAKVGISVPGDDEHKIYVWFDALLNYMTAVGYGWDDDQFNRVWPATAHVVGKDIIKFHCALWPAMLMAAGIAQPKQVFAHGFFTIDGQKISKSLGNAIDPFALVDEVGIDTLRYYLMREITFGEDGDFSVERLKQRYVTELSNELGNLCHRVLSMTEKYCEGVMPLSPPDHDEVPWEEYVGAIEKMQFGKVLDVVWTVVRQANKFIEDEKPWAIAKDDIERVRQLMGHLCETLRQVAWMLVPIMPHVSRDMFTQLGLDADEELHRPFDEAVVWGAAPKGGHIAKGDPLFKRLGE